MHVSSTEYLMAGLMLTCIAVYACSGGGDEVDPAPGDASGANLVLQLDGKTFARASQPASSTVEQPPTPGPRPSPEPTATPVPVPEELEFVTFTGCKTGQACLSKGVFDPQTGRLEYVTATCAMYDASYGYRGECYTYENEAWREFCTVKVYIGDQTSVRLNVGGQEEVEFKELDFAVNVNAACEDLTGNGSPRPEAPSPSVVGSGGIQ